MATRTIENKRDRMATILIAPLMTCSARLPVYTMIIAAFVPDRPLAGIFLGTRAAAMLGLYAVGFLAAVATARLLKSSVLKSHSSPFVMELPTYRWPTLRSLGLRLADRSWAFVSRVGTVVLAYVVRQRGKTLERRRLRRMAEAAQQAGDIAPGPGPSDADPRHPRTARRPGLHRVT